MNILRNKLENAEKICGTLVCLTDPCLCEIVGNVGYDCVWIDTEHTYMSYKDVLCHLNAARSTGIPSVIRLPQNDLTATKKILEMGPDGIIFPMVRNACEAKKLIDMTLYPPYGNRGFGPMRAIRYGADSAKEYVENKSLELCRFMQIEHIDFIDSLEEVVKIPYIDGFIFGPNDLSGSLGDMLNVFDSPTLQQIKRATEILRRHGKYIGVACGCDEQSIRLWSSFDFDMIFSGGDWNFIYNASKETLDKLKQYYK
ncbi:MAG: aldolase [Ruminococcaceae bacterium]|nr:aldolase [Oscillospiraceae bacterium]